MNVRPQVGRASLTTLISGNLAYDTILVVEGSIGDRIVSGGRFVGGSLLASTVGINRLGGSAGNIAYGLHALGLSCEPAAVVGTDCEWYIRSLAERGIGTSRIRKMPAMPTAHCTVLSDDQYQIVAFSLNAATSSADFGLGDLRGITLGVVAPSTTDAMIRHSLELLDNAVPLAFCPGHAVAQFQPTQLAQLLGRATYVIMNEEEARTAKAMTGRQVRDLTTSCAVTVVTLGIRGSAVFTPTDQWSIPAVFVNLSADVTGCGDAYTAGFMAGLASGESPVIAGRMGAVLAGLNAAQIGPQAYLVNHTTAREYLNDLFDDSPPAVSLEAPGVPYF